MERIFIHGVHGILVLFCMKLEHHKGTKVTEPDFWKKILGVTNGEKNPFSGHFWCFCPYLYTSTKEIGWSRNQSIARLLHSWVKKVSEFYSNYLHTRTCQKSNFCYLRDKSLQFIWSVNILVGKSLVGNSLVIKALIIENLSLWKN